VLVAVGLAVGEAEAVRPERFSRTSVAAFAYLVGPGSPGGLLRIRVAARERAAVARLHLAYVNPLVAVFLGWALLSEAVTGVMAAGALAILASVALIVRHDTAVRPPATSFSRPDRRPGPLRATTPDRSRLTTTAVPSRSSERGRR